MTPAREIGRHRTFRWLATGTGLNSAGMQGEQVIIGILVYQMTGSSAWVGLSLALYFAPMLLVGVPAGALADRYDRRLVLIWTEVALVAAMATFSLLLWHDSVQLAAALTMSVLSGALRSIHHPARLSYTGSVAGNHRLVAALSLLGIVGRAGQLIGALLAGVISERYHPGSAYGLLAAGHLLALLCFFKLDDNSVAAQQTKTGLWKSIVDYLHLLRSSSLLLMLIAFVSLVEVLGFSFATALPQIAVDRLALDAEGLGLMHAARSAGGLVGAVLLSLWSVNAPGRLYLMVIVGFGISLVALAVAPQLPTVLLAIALVAVCASASDILSQSMLQLCVPDALRGRAMGAWVVALGMGPLGHLELGLLISLTSTGLALGGNGLVLLLIGIVALMRGGAISRICPQD